MTFAGLPRNIWWRAIVILLGVLTLGSVLSDTLWLSEWLFDLPLWEAVQDHLTSDNSSVILLADPPSIPVYSASLAWQSPTYLLGKEDTTLWEYTCDPAQSVCKVNLIVAPQKDGATSTQLTCLIVADFDLIAGADPCNPNTSVIPPWEYHITIQILQKSDHALLTTREILLKNPPIDTTIDPLRVTSSLAWQSPTYLLLLENTTLWEYTCDPAQTECKINPVVTPFLDGIVSSKLTCSIAADFEMIPSVSDPCNPNTSIVPVGDHTLTIKIIQTSDGTLLQTREILLKNTPDDTTIDPLRVTSSLEWQQTTHLLQKEDTSLSEYTCDPEQAECTINFIVTPFLDGAISSWLTCEITSDFPLEPTSDPCNPANSLVPTGDHTVVIKILQKSDSTVLTTREILLKNSPIDTTIDPARVTSRLSWQLPTYLVNKEDVSLAEYICDSDHTECKVNPLITPLLDGTESPLLTCEITSDFPLESTSDPCNPNTSLVPEGDHILTIKILQKSDNTPLATREILLKNPVPLGDTWAGWSSGGWRWIIPFMDLASSHITIQSGLDADGRCRSGICQVNFLATVPSGALCHWNFWTGIFETTGTDTNCNPWYVKFPFDTPVTLTVSDPNNPVNQVVQSLFVHHETSLTPTLPEAHIDIQGTLGKNKRLIEDGISCELAGSDACSLNFTGEKSLNAKTFFWDFWNGNTSDRENPGIQKYPLGTYWAFLKVTGETGIISEMYYKVEVVKKFDALPEKKCLDCDKMVWKIQISAVLPNPPHADTVEWIELHNLSSEIWNLDTCTLSDDTKTYALSGTLVGQKTLRFRQMTTGLSLGNSHDTLELRCGEILVDTFSWNFEVPSGYILRRDMLDMPPTQGDVVNVVDGDTIDVMLHNKKTRVRLLWVDTPETVHPRKAVEKFGKEASDFTKKTLTGKTVWMTFDHELLDLYGRTLAYIWECNGDFDMSRCTMFNSRLISEGYGRMERRFEFMYYDQFSTLEWVAKKAKLGIWSDPEVAKALGELSDAEAEKLKQEQEAEYLKLQKELLELEKLKCKEDGTCKDILSWAAITEKMSTLSVRANNSWALNVSGRTWWDFPVKISFFLWDVWVYSADVMTNNVGEYELKWYPKTLGEYRVEAIFQNSEPLPTDAPEDDILRLEKNVVLETLSDHFLNPLTGAIVLQGTQWTKNRWIADDGVFHCLSRGSCSVNLTAEVNRRADIRYEWLLPDGTTYSEKNPPALKLEYGDYTVTLKVTDAITGESTESKLQIQHRAIPKAAKKVSSKSSKYTIDLKDATLDIGGGVMPESSSSGIWGTLITLLLLSISSFILFWKYQPNNFIDK